MEQPQLIVDDTGLPPTHHRLVLGDARRMVAVDDDSIALVVTSPPYWTLKKYPDNPAQLGDLDDYELFQKELARVWDECYRVLLPGGRLCVNVGDVTLSRRKHGRHRVVPLHADILANARQAGFDVLTPIFWWKRTNMTTEMSGDTYFLGKPYEPNGIIKNEIEYILLLRKPGGYRKPTAEQRRMSRIPKEDYHAWYRAVWTDIGGASSPKHPAPFPVELANRLVRMFSFAADTVLDPFGGSGTTCLAAARAGRNSVGYDIEATYLDLAERRIKVSSASPPPTVTRIVDPGMDQ
ncbi:MAG: site-specific DNA-methyltransferase [bacterium]|nr:site-specific DNA-methyltransferase [bacterium]MDE0439980.1 site-specific DNA-methyltransferase [bacterium]